VGGQGCACPPLEDKDRVPCPPKPWRRRGFSAPRHLNYFIARAIVFTTRLSKIEGMIFFGVGCFIKEAKFWAARSFITGVIRRTLLSSAPRKRPGNTRALLI